MGGAVFELFPLDPLLVFACAGDQSGHTHLRHRAFTGYLVGVWNGVQGSGSHVDDFFSGRERFP